LSFLFQIKSNKPS